MTASEPELRVQHGAADATGGDPLARTGLEVTITLPTPEAYSTIGRLAQGDEGLPGRVAELVQAASEMSPPFGSIADPLPSIEEVRDFVAQFESDATAVAQAPGHGVVTAPSTESVQRGV